ncbi:MAG: hypothetical protein MI757_16675, partial [Pirellulales bacterium]|nr:hypothetical protein [Pirellulales bacterium]
QWQFSWKNLTQNDPARSQETGGYDFPLLNTDDLYVGVLSATPRTLQTHTTAIDWFTVKVEQ